jgi:hypothetical protein
MMMGVAGRLSPARDLARFAVILLEPFSDALVSLRGRDEPSASTAIGDRACDGAQLTGSKAPRRGVPDRALKRFQQSLPIQFLLRLSVVIWLRGRGRQGRRRGHSAAGAIAGRDAEIAPGERLWRPAAARCSPSRRAAGKGADYGGAADAAGDRAGARRSRLIVTKAG